MSPERKRGPVTPQEAAELQTEQIPDEVFVAFNGLIARRLSGGRAVVYQDEVVELLEAEGLSRQEIYDRHWLDVEASYHASGWKVAYDKPGYNETGRAYFEFKARAGRQDPDEY